MLATHLLVALGLAMDAFAVSVSSGICIPNLQVRQSVRAALAFGLFQFVMPIIGWFAGGTFRAYIESFDHWIAFGLLAFVGGHMIKESFEVETEGGEAVCENRRSILSFGGLLVLAVATSIDALAVGLSYSLLNTPILVPALIIGAVTFLLSLVGCEFGRKIGARFERWAEVAGGAVLIGIGLKILIEHLVQSV